MTEPELDTAEGETSRQSDGMPPEPATESPEVRSILEELEKLDSRQVLAMLAALELQRRTVLKQRLDLFTELYRLRDEHFQKGRQALHLGDNNLELAWNESGKAEAYDNVVRMLARQL